MRASADVLAIAALPMRCIRKHEVHSGTPEGGVRLRADAMASYMTMCDNGKPL